MHEKKYWTLKELIGHWKIEQENILKDKRISYNSCFSRANLVECKSANFDRSKYKRKKNYRNDNKQQG